MPPVCHVPGRTYLPFWWLLLISTDSLSRKHPACFGFLPAFPGQEHTPVHHSVYGLPGSSQLLDKLSRWGIHDCFIRYKSSSLTSPVNLTLTHLDTQQGLDHCRYLTKHLLTTR